MENPQDPPTGQDEAYWAWVLKKWSNSCETVVSLKNDIKIVQEQSKANLERIDTLKDREKTLLRDIERLQRKRHENRDRSGPLVDYKSVLTSPIQTPSEITNNQGTQESRSQLRDMEQGLEKARREYVRLKEQSSALAETVESMNTQIHKLQQEKKIVEEENRVLSQGNQHIALELSHSREESQSLRNQLSSLEDLRIQNHQLRENLATQNDELSQATERQKQLESLLLENNSKMTPYTTEIRALKLAAATSHQEIANLRGELAVAQEKSAKSSETNRTLLENLTKLNEKLRDMGVNNLSMPVLHAHSTSKNQHSLRRADVPGTAAANPRVPSNSMVASSSRQTEMPVARQLVRPTPIPEARQRNLDKLVHFIPDVSGEDCQLTRAVLGKAIGGNLRSLIVRVTDSQTKLARLHDISTYLCPALDLNPWSPISPGQHGYMFVGLGREQNTFQNPHTGLNLFVGYRLPGDSQKKYLYLGIYTAARVVGLSVEEWKSLSEEFKLSYSSTSKEKNKDPRSVEGVTAAYNTGELSVPCVRLQCTGYNEALYTALMTVQQANNSQPLPSVSTRKRRRDDPDDNQRRPRRALHEQDPRRDPDTESQIESGASY